MSIKIHWGPPGSYKTSGAVMDDFIPAAQAGRVVVTNIRGLDNIERIRDALGDIPDSFELIHLPTTEHPQAADNRAKLARWWHWLPHGAFMILDEAQMIWPQSWKDADLKQLDYPGGLEAATADNRPYDWNTAFEMHRHYGWDLVLTTPNIDKIRKDIRGCAEGAFKHKNQAMVGIKGRYLEGFHMAEDGGKSASDFINLRMRKIKPVVWRLYDSTATGTHTDTIAGVSLLANPRVLLLLGILTLVVGFVLYNGRPRILDRDHGPAATGNPPPVDPARPGPAPSPVPGTAVAGGTNTGSPDPLAGFQLVLRGRFGNQGAQRYLIHAESDTATWDLWDSDLKDMGYTVHYKGNCTLRLNYNGAPGRIVGCGKPKESKRGGLAAL
ncbi:zonular occludens toxin domain-containing protein [Methyloterricola oryzae]|uniref:zonular occludens toxin domain-containing protein n=1 Tax=Methyloterricola oryzae TaxID=1495050 RepID=UPI00069B37D6|nr:zonular occludens toxin domain-containing protein [Methyloterricola oryzae]